ncbi:MAG TPA: SOS response-associated peptidase [Solirubrobacteraceae bacterium]|nr:SOS response-associated peptidase [Solirubrobacteraceae bacterium]
MCGRYTNTAGPEEINGRFGVRLPDARGTRRYNIAPTQEVLAIVARAGERVPQLMRWGLLPPWLLQARERGGRASRYSLINARVESALTSRTYGPLLADPALRALQIADGWYEWLHAERRGAPGQPFRFTVDDGAPFAFAALSCTASSADGHERRSIALLTCASDGNAVARSVHARMPVVLADRALQEAWLDPALSGEEALSLCATLPSERTHAEAANPAVGSPRAPEGPELLHAPSPAADSDRRAL